MPIKTIFLDRDGVINEECHYLFKIKDFKFIDGVFDACNSFINLGFKIIIITNQSGIAKKIFSKNDYDQLTNWMLNQFKLNNISILDVLHCPHNSNANCNCRKPKPGMLLEAKKRHSIKMSDSWMIGDKETDIAAGISAGIKKTILVKSGHKIDESKTEAKFILNSIKESSLVIK
jgi:D-glycero-D-manno-heptose 1,7-bisphosphate phosphatase